MHRKILICFKNEASLTGRGRNGKFCFPGKLDEWKQCLPPQWCGFAVTFITPQV